MQADLGAAQFRKSGSGSVTVAASSLTGMYLLPEIIAEFQHSHPGVRITMQLGTAEQAIDLLRSHRAELGFVAGAVAAPEIETEPLFEYDVVIVGKSALVPRRLIARQSRDVDLDIARGGLCDAYLIGSRIDSAGYCSQTPPRTAIQRGARTCPEAGLWNWRHQPLRCRGRAANRFVGPLPGSRMECAQRRLSAPCSRRQADTIC